MKHAFVLVLFSALGATAHAATTPADPLAPKPGQKVKYKAAKNMSFDALGIDGSLQRPDTLMVTGDAQMGGSGLLRLRDDFQDRLVGSVGGRVASKRVRGNEGVEE